MKEVEYFFSSKGTVCIYEYFLIKFAYFSIGLLDFSLIYKRVVNTDILAIFQ